MNERKKKKQQKNKQTNKQTNKTNNKNIEAMKENDETNYYMWK